MTVQGQEYRPDYLIRMLGRFYDELILRNAFHISTGVFTDDIGGRFEILLDNRDPITNRLGLFHLIQPMDYIEIFMKRDTSPVLRNPQQVQVSSSSATAGTANSSVISAQNASFQQWGYVDSNGLTYHYASPIRFAADGSIEPFLIDSNGNISANGGFPDATVSVNLQLPGLDFSVSPSFSSSDFISNGPVSTTVKIARPLSPAEKVNTPTFVFCGLVDSISNDFSIDASGKVVPTLKITGRTMGKILAEHHIFSSSVLFNQLKPISTQVKITGQDPSNAIVYILDTYLKDILNLLYNPDQSVASQSSSKKAQLLQNTLTSITVSLPIAAVYNLGPSAPSAAFTFAVYLRNFINSLDYTIDGDFDNDSNDISPNAYPYSAHGSPQPIGRLLNANKTPGQQRIFHTGNISDGPIITSLEQMCNIFLNELWVDECGRLVLRRIEDAWFQPIFINSNTTSSAPPSNISGAVRTQNVPQYNIDGLGNPIPVVASSDFLVSAQDVVSWSLTKSDNDLKTLVMVQDVWNILAVTKTSSLAGIAPLTTAARRLTVIQTLESLFDTFSSDLLNSNPNIIEIEQKLNNSTLEQIQAQLPSLESTLLNNAGSSGNISLISQAFQNIKNYISGNSQLTTQPLTVWSYALDNDDGITRYWQDFLLRPVSVPSVFSTDVVTAFQQAEVYFQQFSSFMVSGTIVVKGDPTYKAGSRRYFERLNADFYITGVEHDFPWGDGPYLTILHVTRGVFHGRPGGFYPANTFDNSQFLNSVKNAEALVAQAIGAVGGS